MVLPADDRAAISRANGATSRGPRTDFGKHKSSKNSLKTGIYARIHNMSEQDVRDAAKLRENWFRKANPECATEMLLVGECFQAALAAQRFHRAEEAELARQKKQVIS